jgi:hypothetical protein
VSVILGIIPRYAVNINTLYRHVLETLYIVRDQAGGPSAKRLAETPGFPFGSAESGHKGLCYARSSPCLPIQSSVGNDYLGSLVGYSYIRERCANSCETATGTFVRPPSSNLMRQQQPQTLPNLDNRTSSEDDPPLDTDNWPLPICAHPRPSAVPPPGSPILNDQYPICNPPRLPYLCQSVFICGQIR